MPEQPPSSSGSVSPIMAGLLDHRVSAQVKDLDHYRIHGGISVETDFIIHVNCVPDNRPGLPGGTMKKQKRRPEPDFEPFIISKTFSHFRSFTDQLHKEAEAAMSSSNKLYHRSSSTKDSIIPIKVKNLANYCETVFQLIESQRTQYLGKVRSMYDSNLRFCLSRDY